MYGNYIVRNGANVSIRFKKVYLPVFIAYIALSMVTGIPLYTSNIGSRSCCGAAVSDVMNHSATLTENANRDCCGKTNPCDCSIQPEDTSARFDGLFPVVLHELFPLFAHEMLPDKTYHCLSHMGSDSYSVYSASAPTHIIYLFTMNLLC